MIQLQPIHFDNFKAIILGISTAHFAFDSYLKYRQYKAIQQPPPVPNGVAFKTVADNKDAKLTKATSKYIKYWKMVYKFDFVSDLISIVEDLMIFKLDLLPKLWNYAGRIVSKWFGSGYGITQSLLFLGAYTLVSFVPDLALRYKAYTIEKHYGATSETLGSWLISQMKSFALNNVFGAGAVGLSLKMIELFWKKQIIFLFSLLIIGYNITTLLLTPSKLMQNKSNVPPLFHNQNKPNILQDIPLRRSINELAKQMDFQLDAICIVNKFQNWGDGRVCIMGPLQFFKVGYVSEDLINNSYNDPKQKDKLLALLAHEMSHWTLSHFQRLAGFELFWGVVGLNSLNQFLTNPLFYSSIGFSSGVTPQIVGLVVFSRFIRGHINSFFRFLNNLIISSNIHESDSYVVSLGYKSGLKRALIDQINENGLSSLNKDWLYLFSCPIQGGSSELIERIIRIDEIDELTKNTLV